MSWLIEAATVLNGGRRREALIELAKTLGVSPRTVRDWAREGDMPKHQQVAVRALVQVKTLGDQISKIREAVDAIISEKSDG